MIARHDAPNSLDKPTLWSALAAPLDADATVWRQEGAPVAREGGWYARFVAHPAPNAVRERLDRVVPGEWDLTLELLPSLPARPGEAPACAFKARLQILGVIREDVGTGADYKTASTDAFARAAVRFGIGHELSDREPNWVAVAGAGEEVRPTEAPAAADARRAARVATRREAAAEVMEPAVAQAGAAPVATAEPEPRSGSAEPVAVAVAHDDDPACPKCGSRMWDNRLSKRNPKAPDFKCRDRSCDGVIWPPRGSTSSEAQAGAPQPAQSRSASRGSSRSRAAEPVAVDAGFDASPLGGGTDDDLPF